MQSFTQRALHLGGAGRQAVPGRPLAIAYNRPVAAFSVGSSFARLPFYVTRFPPASTPFPA
eukprot:6006338-Alexandrium_andersonii.AAC.1